ncbi:MAG TPA: hypothetical protein VFA46_10095 [Actinomycetes bacterium]|jgi:hypothetical protein|nr:hypothetical protein [Actinomycetes bacterium]
MRSHYDFSGGDVCLIDQVAIRGGEPADPATGAAKSPGGGVTGL